MPLNCRAITLTAGAILKLEKKPSLIRERQFGRHLSANRGLPLPLGRAVCETKSKKGRARDRKPFGHRVYSGQRGIETMVSDHGLGRGQTMGRGRSEFAEF